MDYQEVIKGFSHRHPWELSRTHCVYKSLSKYIDKIHKANPSSKFINIGAGDCFFDNEIIKNYSHKLAAIDIAYPDEVIAGNNSESSISHYRSLAELPADSIFDYGIMMDSLEYFEDSTEIIRELSNRIRPGGYIFLTLPAHKKLFSDHDRIVGNLYRFDKHDIYDIADKIPGLSVENTMHFYLSLYLVRWFQLHLKLKIDPDQKVTTGWNHSEQSLITKLPVWVLNLDYFLCRVFHLTGLSMLAIIKKADD